MAQTNTTIDDSDPAFSFPGVNWNAITPSTPCGGCATKLDLSQTYNNTYHDGDFDTSGPMTGSFQFEGTAVYLYGITALAETAELSFVVDNGPTVNFDLSTVSLTNYVYNTLLFSSSNLINGPHTLSWTLILPTTSPFTDVPGAIHDALIDYAVVTSDDDSSSSPSSPSSVDSTESSNGTPITLTKTDSTTLLQTQTVSSLTTMTGTTSPSGTSSHTSSISATSKKSTRAIAPNSKLASASSTNLVTIDGTSGAVSQSSSAPSSTSVSGEIQSGGSNTKLIIAAALGSVAGVGLIAFAVLFVRRKTYLDARFKSPESALPFDLRIPFDLTIEGGYPSEKMARQNTFARHRQVMAREGGDHPDEPQAASSTGQIQQIEQRVGLIERILQAPNERPASWGTSPPPY